MLFDKHKISSVLLLLIVVAIAPGAAASDVDDLKKILNEFLAGVDTAAAHERFWADDLVYTSSRGIRTNKAEIMQGFSAPKTDEGDEDAPIYSADDIKIQVYGTTAIVAFKLVATPVNGANKPDSDSRIRYYFNTGTFLRRDGVWQVVAWQATSIPEP